MQSAETTLWLAWELQARLPGTGALLAAGTLTLAKARAVAETFRFLTDAGAARAEAMIAAQLAGKTYPQVLRLAEQAALTVDPELATRRRKQAQQNARVTFFREESGTAALSGRDLPPDEALAAMAGVGARAQAYEDSGAYARESDFEHAVPYAAGGRTDACNAGARSRACHRVKQARGWKVVPQQRPGWHAWHTPSGRVYTQEPKRYPA